jgi:acetolactate decarboxylase
MRVRTIAMAALALVLAGCGGAPKTADAPVHAVLAPGITTWGELHRVMMQGDTAAVVSLETITPDTALYAVGALAGLNGEITIAGGEIWIATPLDAARARDTVATFSSESACLLVAAQVGEWREVPIEEAIPYDSLDARIAALAAGAGVDTAAPFAFVIEGPLSALEWHVIDGRRIDPAAAGHAAHLNASVRRRLDHVSAGLVGFYSTAHEGVFTHRGSYTHVHAIVPAAGASGHVDHVVVEPGATLRVPAR